MKRLILAILSVLSVSGLIFSQNIKEVSATYTYNAPENLTIEEAKRTALKWAQIQAMEEAFGSVVSQLSSIHVSESSGGNDSSFFSNIDAEVKGEWIETIGEPTYEGHLEDRYLVVTCTVRGKAREIEKSGIDFVAKPLRNGTSLKYESTNFKEGDDLYLYFKSPIDGYVAVYLLDEATQEVYSILPYRTERISSTPIVGEKEYVFFSEKEAEKSERSKVDEYTLSCENETDYNTIFILFSPANIGKRIGFKPGAHETPQNISYMDFKKWLSNSLSKDKNLQLMKQTITIKKN